MVMKINLIQTDIQWANPEANRNHAADMMRGMEKADLYILPEMFSTGFATQPEGVAEEWQQGTCPSLEWMKGMAVEMDAAVAGSIAIRQEDGRYYNRFCFVRPDGETTLYDKHHLFTFGGEPPKDQRIYYFNTKELMGNKYGTPSPVPFRVVDHNIGLDTDISIRCFGEFSYRICDPMLFYKNVCGNVSENYTRDNLDGQMKTELLTALGPAFAKISEKGIRYSALPGHTFEIAEALNEVLTPKWRNLRGVEIVSFGVSNVNASEEDEAMIKDLQKSAVYRNAGMAGAALVGAQADAMKAAAKNENGAMMGFMGMNMANNAGGMNPGNLYAMGQAQAQQMQQDMKNLKADLEEREFSATSGGGLVEVTVDGKHFIKSIKINSDAIDPEDPEMIEDLVTVAVNEAIGNAIKTSEEEMAAITGGLNIPGLF